MVTNFSLLLKKTLMAEKWVKSFGRGRVNPVSSVFCCRLFHVSNVLASRVTAWLWGVFPRAAFPCLSNCEVLPCKCFLTKTWLVFDCGTVKSFYRTVNCWNYNSTKKNPKRATACINKYFSILFSQLEKSQYCLWKHVWRSAHRNKEFIPYQCDVVGTRKEIWSSR